MKLEPLIDPQCGKPAFWMAQTLIPQIYRRPDFFCESCNRPLHGADIHWIIIAARTKTLFS